MITKIRKLQFDSYPQALKDMARTLNSREFSFDEYYIVLCPDRYTLAVEQALFCGGGRGAMDCEVLTLSRLSRRVAPAAKTLSQEGGIMLTAQAIDKVKNKLGYYAKAAAFDDFAREAYTTIQQIVASDVSAPPISAKGATKIKLNDLALIKAEYDRLKGDHKDASDKLFALISAAATDGLIKNVHFSAIGYSDATKLITRVFSVLAEHAKSFTLYEAPPPEKKRESLPLHCAPDRISEYKQVATEIRDHVFNGGRYDDVAVICDSPRALKRILGEYDIPAYTDESRPLYFTPPLSAIENVYKLHCAINKRNGVDCAALVALCKNPYAGCNDFDAEKLLDEVYTRGFSYVSPDYTFEGGAGVAARRAMDIVRAFGACNNFADGVERIIELCDFAGKRQRQAEQATDAVTPVTELVETLRLYGSNEFDTDAKAFFSAAQSVNVNTLPREHDCVTVTKPSSLRMSAVKKLFITDFNEGVMPQAIADTGLISDAELNMMGGAIEPTCAKRNRQFRDELKAVVVNADSVYVVYSAADGRPATFISELAEDVLRYDLSENGEVLLETHDARFIAKHASVPAAAREMVARKLSRHAPSVAAATQKSGAVCASFEDRIRLTHKSTLSGSEITDWFRCPYYRFLKHSVGIAERHSGFGAVDFGVVLHDFMRRFVEQQAPYDFSEPTVNALLEEALAQNKITLDPATYSRILSDAMDYAEINAKILEKGDYEVAQTEYKFDGKTLGTDGRFKFIGYIDRFDLCDGRARIIDYKTGDKKFDIKKCLDGRDMQLPLYAYALPYEITGIFYVRAVKRYYTEKPDRPLSGVMVKDVDVALEYDDLEPGGAWSDIFPVRLVENSKTGEVGFHNIKSYALLERDRFDALIAACKSNADVAADEIADGYICRSPAQKACDSCPYIGICGGGLPRTETVDPRTVLGIDGPSIDEADEEDG